MKSCCFSAPANRSGGSKISSEIIVQTMTAGNICERLTSSDVNSAKVQHQNVDKFLAANDYISSSICSKNSGGVLTNIQRDELVISCAQVVSAIKSEPGSCRKRQFVDNYEKENLVNDTTAPPRLEQVCGERRQFIYDAVDRRVNMNDILATVKSEAALLKIGPPNAKRPRITPSRMSDNMPESTDLSYFNQDVTLKKEKSKPKRSTMSAFDRQILSSSESMEVASNAVEKYIPSNTDQASLVSEMANNVSLNGGHVNKREYTSNDKVSSL